MLYFWGKYGTMIIFNNAEIGKQLALILSPSDTSDQSNVAMEAEGIYGLSYDALLEDDYRVMTLSEKGISQNLFYALKDVSPFNLEEWARFLHLSRRTIIRYKNEQKPFETLSTDRIIEISKLIKRGVEVFGTTKNFNYWLRSPVFALGNVPPMDFLQSSFGIKIILDQLGRIEHGILA